MNNEFKKTIGKNQTVYTLESASGGGTSSGSIASVDSALGGMQRRNPPGDNILAQEKKEPPKPRNFVAKNAKMGGAGQHKDKKKAEKQGDVKHRKPFAEGAPELLKKEMPLHRHAEKLLAQNGVSKDDPDYNHHLGNTIKHLRQFGNIDLINKSDEQGVAEGERTMSRAAKGNEKYGKDGMKALAKAGRDGASEKKLDAIRDKHDNYNEEWSKKYKSSINCSHPKGFSQKAHCAGKKKHNEDMTMEATCPDCGMCQTHGNLSEIKKGAKDSNGVTSCWSGYHAAGTKKSATTGKQVRNCVPNEDVAEEAKHGLYYNVNKRKAAGTSRPASSPKAPTAQAWKDAAKTAKSEGIAENPDWYNDEANSMSSSQLKSLYKHAMKLRQAVKHLQAQGNTLEPWQQSKVTKAADYLDAVFNAVDDEHDMGEQTELESVGVPSYGVGGYRNRGDDERHDLDDPELQQNRQEVTSYNITINGKPVNPKPIFGRSATIAWGKKYAATGVDLSNAVISPVRDQGMAEADPQGWGADSYNTYAGTRYGRGVMEDEYMAELAAKLAEKISANAPVDTWVQDFQKADPQKYHQFKNKTPAKKAQMAVAASYAAKNPSKK